MAGIVVLAAVAGVTIRALAVAFPVASAGAAVDVGAGVAGGEEEGWEKQKKQIFHDSESLIYTLMLFHLVFCNFTVFYSALMVYFSLLIILNMHFSSPA
jgi:hypothetical protein